MFGFFKFWWKAILSAFAFSWLVFGVMSTSFPAVISLIQKYWPALESIRWIKFVADNQVEIQCCIAGLVLALYLLYAPYRLYKEQGAQLAALSGQGNKREITEKLAEFLVEGEHWKSICHNPKLQIFPGDQISLWATKLDTYLTRELGNSYAVRVKSSSGLPSLLATNLAPGVEQGTWRAIHIRCVRLNQFLEELSSQPKSPISSSRDQT
jgi:hypothetical protein